MDFILLRAVIKAIPRNKAIQKQYQFTIRQHKDILSKTKNKLCNH